MEVLVVFLAVKTTMNTRLSRTISEMSKINLMIWYQNQRQSKSPKQILSSFIRELKNQAVILILILWIWSMIT